MLAITISTLYTSVWRRGTTSQLSGAIVTCVISALLLLPALVWYDMRFTVEQAALSLAEVEVVLVYVALFGWCLPLSVTIAYCLFALPRTSTTAVEVPRQKRTLPNPATALNPPRHQLGVEAPYVFGEDTPWGWLEYRNGRFQGQRLALKRAVVTIGRGEDNEIWLDDDLASRHHAELAWDQGTIYITDCDSLNGVLLNGQRIRRSAIVEPGALLEIGSHRFLFEKAEEPRTPAEQDDPLVRHVWHSTADLHMENATVPMAQPVEEEETLRQPLSSDALGTRPLEDEDTIREPLNMDAPLASGPLTPPAIELQETATLRPVPSTPQPPGIASMFTIRDGEMAGYSFVLDRPVLTIGRGPECDVVINDVSISRRHAQVLRQAHGNYVQDLASRNGTKVNDEPLHAPHLLQSGDVVCLGSIRLEYTVMRGDPTVPIPVSMTPPPIGHPIGGPLPLRLPSRPKVPPT